MNKKVKFLFAILLVIAQVPAAGPDPSDEKVDFDDDTLKGEKHNYQKTNFYILKFSLNLIDLDMRLRGITTVFMGIVPRRFVLRSIV